MQKQNFLYKLEATLYLPSYRNKDVTISTYGGDASLKVDEDVTLEVKDMIAVLAAMRKLKKAYRAAEAVYQSQYGD